MCPEFQKNFQSVHFNHIKIWVDAPNYCYEYEINSEWTKKSLYYTKFTYNTG